MLKVQFLHFKCNTPYFIYTELPFVINKTCRSDAPASTDVMKS